MPYRASRRRKHDPVVVYLIMMLGSVVLTAGTAIYLSQSAMEESMIEGKPLGIAIADRFVDTDKLRRTHQEKWEPVTTPLEEAKPGGKPADFYFPDYE